MILNDRDHIIQSLLPRECIWKYWNSISCYNPKGDYPAQSSHGKNSCQHIGCTNLSELNPYTQNPTKKLKYNWNTPWNWTGLVNTVQLAITNMKGFSADTWWWNWNKGLSCQSGLLLNMHQCYTYKTKALQIQFTFTNINTKFVTITKTNTSIITKRKTNSGKVFYAPMC